MAIVLAVLVGAITSARSSSVLITSPDQAQTYAYGEMIWRQLSIDPATQTLTARITFSNRPYAGSPESRVDEPFDFRFPKTRIDPATQTAFVRDRQGHHITIARFRGDPTNGWIDLASGTKIYLLKHGGCVTAVLTATSEPRPGMRWIQMDDNLSLQNLLTRFCKG